MTTQNPKQPAREAHNITPEQCMALVPSGFVCPGCGGTLEPIDTVDNAGTPTYWAGCNVCHKFSWGVSAETFDMARWLVDERKENFYHDLDASRESQIRGWTGIAGEIIRRTLSTRETEIAEVEKMNAVLREQNTELSAHNLTQAAELAKVREQFASAERALERTTLTLDTADALCASRKLDLQKVKKELEEVKTRESVLALTVVNVIGELKAITSERDALREAVGYAIGVVPIVDEYTAGKHAEMVALLK